MITRIVLSLALAAIVLGMLCLVGWALVTLFEHHFRIFLALAIALVGFIFYIELGDPSLGYR